MKRESVRSVIQEEFSELDDGEHAIHHVFPGSRRRLSEKYGYLVRVIPETHNFIHDHPNKATDLWLKQTAQRHYEKHHGTRRDFIHEFGRSYL